MDISALLLFIPACFALNMAPGPNNLLSVSNATRYGFKRSSLAGFGRLLAFAIMIALASAGLAAVLQTSAMLFQGLKIIGAAYLIYLAIQLWRAEPDASAQAGDVQVSMLRLAWQEFLVAAGNPKAILIFSAFLPQFVDVSRPVAGQFMVLGAMFLCLEVIAICAYAGMGVHLQRWFAEPRGKRLFNRGCAVLLTGAASMLLVARRS
ncbi:LysE family translocator [Pseudomonas sp. LS1212]|uniref:LysE family translocator n=1 Tax=Pseudomonas sp. LS1212 TaxID=2972478 RepID=UPI00215BF1A3|nr:LysE family translocator [Pseudomonas sp. LS1212]UVJ46550.1 LysE family translocator [Pseudomonas sp. LS1212]